VDRFHTCAACSKGWDGILVRDGGSLQRGVVGQTHNAVTIATVLAPRL
jgi:hypothetical protein